MTRPGSVKSAAGWIWVEALTSRPWEGEEFRQTKIQNLHPPVFGDEKIVGLEVAMNDALAVSGGQAVRDLQRVVRGFTHGQRNAVHLFAQRPAFEQLTHKIRCALVNPGIVNGQHVRMIQGRQRLGLLLEAPQPIRVRHEVLWQHLHRHVAIEPGVPCAEDRAHGAFTQEMSNLVGTKF